MTLSKTKKKGRGHKEAIVNAIKQAVEDYSSAYVFTFENMRNQKLKDLRDKLKSSSRYSLQIVMIICLSIHEQHETEYISMFSYVNT